jgi:hypothetical protein
MSHILKHRAADRFNEQSAAKACINEPHLAEASMMHSSNYAQTMSHVKQFKVVSSCDSSGNAVDNVK